MAGAYHNEEINVLPSMAITGANTRTCTPSMLKVEHPHSPIMEDDARA